MPSDDYAAVGGGALRLKGAKVSKSKTATLTSTTTKKKKKKAQSRQTDNLQRALSAQAGSVAPEATADSAEHQLQSPDPALDTDHGPAPGAHKTESERRYEETKKKRLLQMTQASGARSDLLKTHKERVEELNTYLSKLSEHHDMPKIGPG